MVCGRYGFSVWPIWFSVVADIVLLWLMWFVADVVPPTPPQKVITPKDYWS